MVEVVDRLEAEEQRRVAVRLEDDGGEQRRLETVRAPLADDAPEAAQRGPAARFLVVGQRVEVALDGARRPQPRDQAPLAGREGAARLLKLPEVREHLVGRPVVAGVDLHQLAVGVDDRGPQVVRDVALVG